MIQNKEYLLYTTHETSYLLPTGQARYSGKKQLRLNQLGVFIWKQLETEKTMDELFTSVISQFSVKNNEKEDFRKQVYSFISYCLNESIVLNPGQFSSFQSPGNPVEASIAEQLSSLNYISSTDDSIISKKETFFFEIAALTCSYIGDESCFPKDFDRFVLSKTPVKTDLTYYIRFVNGVAPCETLAIPLISTKEVLFYNTGKEWLIKPLLLEGILEIHLSYDGHTAFLLCDLAYRNHFKNKDYPEGNPLFLAMRYPFLYAIENRGMLAIHSSSIVYQNKVWLFSALSGTGKTTHTNLWNKLFQTPVFNGDLCVIGECNQQAYAYGIPWCGTSKDAMNQKLPLGGIVLLKQDKTNYVSPIPKESQAISLFNRLLTTSHTSLDTLKTLDCLTSLLETGIFTGTLYCNLSENAAYVMKTAIDSYLCDNLSLNRNE